MHINKERKIKLIVAEEYSITREVALGIIMKKPLRAWLYIIPGMFIVDFLRRGKEIKRYGDHYMFPRKLALEAIQYNRANENIDTLVSEYEKAVSDRLNALNLFSSELRKMYITVLRILIEHYEQLIEQEGNTYADLITAAYKDRVQYESFLDQLSSHEKEIDNAIARSVHSVSLRESLLLGQEQLGIMREKHADVIFLS